MPVAELNGLDSYLNFLRCKWKLTRFYFLTYSNIIDKSIAD